MGKIPTQATEDSIVKKKNAFNDKTAKTNITSNNSNQSSQHMNKEQASSNTREGKKERENLEYEEVIKAQKRRAVGKLMLLYGKTDEEVIENAQLLHMSTDDFLVLCQKWIDDYDEIHKKYNETHSKTIDYPKD